MNEINNTIKQLSFTAIFKEAWVIFKKRGKDISYLMMIPFLVLVGIIAVLGLILCISSGTFNISVVMQDFVLKMLTWNNEYQITSMIIYCLLMTVLVLVLLYFSIRSLIASVKILKSEHEYITGNVGGSELPMTIKHAWKVSFGHIKSVLWVMCILAAVIIGGYVAFIIPGLILLTFYINSLFTNILENKNGTLALTASRENMRGFGPFVFINYAILIIASFVASEIIQEIFLGLGLGIVKLFDGGLASALVVGMIAFLLWFIASFFIKAFGLVFGFIMYKHLKSINSNRQEDVIQQQKDKNVVLFWSVFGVVAVITILILVSVFGSRYDKFERQQDINDRFNPMMGKGVNNGVNMRMYDYPLLP